MQNDDQLAGRPIKSSSGFIGVLLRPNRRPFRSSLLRGEEKEIFNFPILKRSSFLSPILRVRSSLGLGDGRVKQRRCIRFDYVDNNNNIQRAIVVPLLFACLRLCSL